jgi:hypothetical protein
MEIFHFIILLNEIAINSDFTGTIPGTSLTLYLQNVPNGTLNIKKMKITLYLRKSKVAEETATICIRIRDGKTDFRTATPFIVNSQYWDNTKLAYKARSSTLASRNSSILLMNVTLMATILNGSKNLSRSLLKATLIIR